MKLIRKIHDNKISNVIIPALAVLFVFSLSFHTHSFGENTTTSFDSHAECSHSVEDCSACLLQGNLQVPKIGYINDNKDLGLCITYTSNKLVVPNSFVNIDRPSRAPPIV